MAHWAVPHDVAGFGAFVGLLGIACAAYIQMVFDPPVPARYPSALALSGAGLVAMNASTVQALTPEMLLAMRQVNFLAAFVLFVGGTARVLIEAGESAPDRRTDHSRDRDRDRGRGRDHGGDSDRDGGRGPAGDASAAPATPRQTRRLDGPADAPEKTLSAEDLDLVVDHYTDKIVGWIR